MSKQEKRARLFGRLGLVSSLLSAACLLGIMAILFVKRGPAEGLFDLGTARQPAALLSSGLAFVFGFLGFLGGLEGAAYGEGQIKARGWLAFWIGVIGVMAGATLGLCTKFYGY